MNSRQLVLRIITEFDRRPGNLERLFDQGMRGVNIDHRDRRLVFEIVYGVIRRKGTIDYIIDHYLTDNAHFRDPQLRRILSIGIYQLLYLDRVPDHAAVNESVKLAKSDSRSARFAGTVNAVMHELIKNKKRIDLPDPQKDLALRLSVEFSHPLWMINRWLKQLGLARTKALLAYNNEKPPIFLRRALRIISRQQFEADVRQICDPATGFMNLYYKLQKALLPENIRMIKEGMCNVQAPSSGWVIALMDVQKGDHLIDVCAAPGGKSALLSELASDEGTVCACEVVQNRMFDVVETIERMRLRNVYPLLCDGIYLPIRGVFDKALLDAPCSGSGVLHRHPEARWIKKEEDLVRLCKVQEKLLTSIASHVTVGGVLVYATCSIEPEENEMQVEKFLALNQQFVLDPCPQVVPEKFIDKSGYLRITPFEHSMDGMFAARLRRVS